MSWKPNEKLRAALLKRLSVLLGSDDPAKVLAFMVKQVSRNYPGIDLRTDYSIVEDLAVQQIIKKYGDHKLDMLWTQYNFGYFQEDTESLLKSKLGEGYENFIRNLIEDPDSVNFCRGNLLQS